MKRFLLIALLLPWLPALPVPANTAQEKEDIYVLPQYVVTSQRILPPPESWRYAVTPQFEILSNASDRTTQKFHRDIGEYIDVLNNIAPAMRPGTAVPIKLIICGESGAFRKLTGTAGVPVVTGQASGQISFAINVSTDFVIPLDSGSYDADDNWAYIQNRVFRNYIDLRLNQITPRLPAWFEHALRTLFTAMKFNGNKVTLGEIRDGQWSVLAPVGTIVATPGAPAFYKQGAELIEDSLDIPTVIDASPSDMTSGDAMMGDEVRSNWMGGPDGSSGELGYMILQRHPVMNMAEFLAYDPRKPAIERLPASFNRATWARQCILFTHYWLYRRTSQPKDKAAFMQFVKGFADGIADEEFFKKCFGLSYRTMALELANYQEYTDYNYQLFSFKEDTLPPPLELRDATPAEVGRMKGEAMITFGKRDEGYHHMLAPYMRKQADPDLYAALGLVEHEQGAVKKARAFLEAAFKSGNRRPDACRVLSRLRRDEITADSDPSQRFTPAQLNAIIEPLLAARTLRPYSAQTYVMLADALRCAEEPPDEEQAKIVLEGVNRYPKDATLTVLAAMVMVRGGFEAPASLLVQRGLNQPGLNEDARAWVQEAAAHFAQNPSSPPAAP